MDPQAATFEAALHAAIDGKTKPSGSLGRIEELAARLARLQGTLAPRAERCRLFLIAADHGIAAQGVSAYPQAVTRQMVLNFLRGGAAATVFARTLGVEVTVVDAGVAGDPIRHPALLDRRLGPGTADSSRGPAMTPDQAKRALAQGEALGREADADVVATGEMGIANTTAAALLAGKLEGLDPVALAGRGTGLDDAGLAHKRAVIARAAARTADRLPPDTALAEYGGFEIGTLAGVILGAARARRLVLIDGFIATAAALLARALDPSIRPALVCAHRSAEPGHAVLLEALGARPLLDLELRLGEGTGALLAWPLVRAAAAMLSRMASFEEAGVSRS